MWCDQRIVVLVSALVFTHVRLAPPSVYFFTFPVTRLWLWAWSELSTTISTLSGRQKKDYKEDIKVTTENVHKTSGTKRQAGEWFYITEHCSTAVQCSSVQCCAVLIAYCLLLSCFSYFSLNSTTCPGLSPAMNDGALSTRWNWTKSREWDMRLCARPPANQRPELDQTGRTDQPGEAVCKIPSVGGCWWRKFTAYIITTPTNTSKHVLQPSQAQHQHNINNNKLR